MIVRTWRNKEQGINLYTGVPKKKDESIAPLFISGF
jgi:hypothetical protein